MCFYVLEKVSKVTFVFNAEQTSVTDDNELLLIEHFHSITTGRLLKNSVRYTKKLVTL